MKRLIMYMTLLGAATILSGCGSSDTDYRGETSELITLFLVDERGFSYGDIPYKCNSMTRWSKTKSNGEFTFEDPDACTFNFDGLRGVYNDGYDDVVRIVDDLNKGKGGISYDCKDFGVSKTDSDGSFEYNENDECTFYL